MHCQTLTEDADAVFDGMQQKLAGKSSMMPNSHWCIAAARIRRRVAGLVQEVRGRHVGAGRQQLLAVLFPRLREE